MKFKDEDYLYIKEDSEMGLWCVGNLEVDGKKSAFKRVVRSDEIKEIRVKKFSIVRTSLFLIIMLSPIYLTQLLGPSLWGGFGG